MLDEKITVVRRKFNSCQTNSSSHTKVQFYVMRTVILRIGKSNRIDKKNKSYKFQF
nr:MAG TPA: hypothetical protein [Bacteriophage sp.]